MSAGRAPTAEAVAALIRRERRGPLQLGMTLLELMFAIVIAGVLASMAVAGYKQVIERTKVSQAVADIGQLQLAINKYWADHSNAYPVSLADVGFGALLDPWGNPYEYFDLSTAVGKGKMRKDKNLVPINSDFDLYSKGPDGDSKPPLTAAASRDDIVRANDGHFIGKAEDY